MGKDKLRCKVDYKAPEYDKYVPSRVIILNRVLEYDPAIIYERLKGKLDYNRQWHNKHDFHTRDAFPDVPGGKCACGCGKTIEYKVDEYGIRRSGGRRYYNHECKGFVDTTLKLIKGYTSAVYNTTRLYKGHKCDGCNAPRARYPVHIVPPSKGGGACWVQNYRLLCKSCLEKHQAKK